MLTLGLPVELNSVAGTDITTYVIPAGAKLPLSLGTDITEDNWGWPQFDYFFYYNGQRYDPAFEQVASPEYTSLMAKSLQLLGLEDKAELKYAFNRALEAAGPDGLPSRFYRRIDYGYDTIGINAFPVSYIDAFYINGQLIEGTYDPITCAYTNSDGTYAYFYSNGNWYFPQFYYPNSASSIAYAFTGALNSLPVIEVYGRHGKLASEQALMHWVQSYYLEQLARERGQGDNLKSVKVGGISVSFDSAAATKLILDLRAELRRELHSGPSLVVM